MFDKLKRNEYIDKAMQIHGNRYDYSKVDYKNTRVKIIIICSKHGEFLQRPDIHLSKHGCPRCAGNLKYSNEEYIKKAKEIHGNKYDYSKVDYKNNKCKIIIICPKHGEFLQCASSHLEKKGCIDCLKLDFLDFLNESKKYHGDKYNYSKVKYNSRCDKIIIICPRHGEFKQIAYTHMRGHGCSKCSRGFNSNKESFWLDTLNISNNFRNYILKHNDKKYIVDGYDDSNNIIYEFYGDYWHGNPKIYDPNIENTSNNKLFGDLYKITINREKELKSFGYKVVSIWEADFDKKINYKRKIHGH